MHQGFCLSSRLEIDPKEDLEYKLDGTEDIVCIEYSCNYESRCLESAKHFSQHLVDLQLHADCRETEHLRETICKS